LECAEVRVRPQLLVRDCERCPDRQSGRSPTRRPHPRPDFKRRILRAFNDGNKHRPHSTFGNVNADVLEHFDPSFVRDDFVDIILKNSWPE
jgi:hypothetical protein